MANIPLYRYFNPKVGHFYTTNFNELGQGALGYSLERVECLVDSSGASGTGKFYRFRFATGPGAHFYTTTYAEFRDKPFVKGRYIEEGYAGFLYTAKSGNLIPLFRYYNGPSNDYFYTTFIELKNTLQWNDIKAGRTIPSIAGYTFEGIQGWVNEFQ